MIGVINDVRCPRLGSEATEPGEGGGGCGVDPPHTVRTFQHIRVHKSRFRAFNKGFFFFTIHCFH